jgi:nucleoid DNA-binding protein
MTYAEFITQAAGQAGTTKKAARAMLSAAFDVLGTAAAEGRLEVPRFGVFLRRERRARSISSPLTKAKMHLPESCTVGFRASKELRAKAAAR